MSRVGAALCRAVREQATGALEWRDEQRRRLFFFDMGELVLVQSNLKSESPGRVQERVGTPLDPTQLAEAVALTRVREAVRESGGAVTFHAGAAAPSFEPLDVVALLWGAAELFPPPVSDWPRTLAAGAPLLARLPVDGDLGRYLLELDGSRPLDDVRDFAPADPDVLDRALAIGEALGAVVADPRPETPVVAAPPAPAIPTPPGAPRTRAPEASVDDIAAFIRGALHEEDGDPPSARTPTPTPSPVSASALFTAASAPAASAPAVTFASAAEPDDDGPTAGPQGASATIHFPLGRAAAPAQPPPPPAEPDPVEAYFGPTLARIRGAGDHFGVLGTGWQDAPETHRRAYLGLAQRLHPDRIADQPKAVRAVAEELFDRVHAAWEVLGDDARREAYIAKVIRGEKTEDERAMDKVRAILDAEADFKRGIVELNAGKIPAAHALLTKAATAMPEEVEFGAYAGYTAFKLAFGRDDAAATEGARKVSAALQANDNLDGVWVLHGMVLKAQGQDAAARRAFVQALKLKPSNPDAARELKRLERDQPPPEPAAAKGGFFSKLFGKR